MSDEPKIVTPSAEEAARYGGDPGPKDDAGSAAEDATAQEGQGAASGGRAEAEQWREKFLRAKAELANYQKRAQKERADSIRFATSDLVKSLLSVLDDLDRLIASGAEGKADAASFVEGAKLLRDNFLKALSQFNVSQIESQGQPFDPEIHQAIMELPSPEHEPQTVVQEVAKGYRMHDRVLRPARVVVAKAPEKK